MTEKEALEMVVKYSPKCLCELVFYHKDLLRSELLPEDLEFFLISWKNRVSQKSLSLIIVRNYNAMNLDTSFENIKMYIVKI